MATTELRWPKPRVLLLLCALSVAAPAGANAALDTAKIEQLTGAAGTLDQSEGVFKVSVPRSDLAVTVAGVKMTPALGLTSWAAFQTAGEQTMVMGDMVLQDDQVSAALDAALNNGLQVTALHNHFLRDTPKIMFMHIGGMGATEALAAAVGKVFAAIKASSGGKGHVAELAIDPATSTFDPALIDGVLGVKGTMGGGVYKIVIGRPATMHGHPIGGAMGVNTWAAFAGSDAQAVVDGDFVMRESELQPVLKALRAAHIDVVAIHNHMTLEEPRMLFLHYWGIGSTRALASGLRAALAMQSK